MKNKLFSLLFAVPLIIFLSKNVMAHCPLCTIGAGALGAGAIWLGISPVVVALFIGAFAMSMGMWFARVIKKQYVPFQKILIVAIIFFTTVIPLILMPIFKALGPLYLSFIGDYGTTYVFNYSLASSFLGGLIVLSTPSISKFITKKRNYKTLPFQGTLLTLALLVVVGVLIQFSLAGLESASVEGSIEKISPEKFENIIQNESVFLLNVHTPYEGQINGTDLIIEDWENIDKYMEKLPMNPSIPIAVYCRSGRMSGAVAEELKKMGYKVYDLDGGMIAWEESGRKIIS